MTKRPTEQGYSEERRLNYHKELEAEGLVGLKASFLEKLQYGELSPIEIAGRMGIPAGLVNEWRREDERFALQYEILLNEREAIAHALRVPSVEDKLYRKALGGDTRAMEIYLRARFPEKYGEKAEIKHSGVVVTLTGDELARIFREARGDFLQAGGKPLGLADGGGDGERPSAGSGSDQVPALAPPAESPSGD